MFVGLIVEYHASAMELVVLPVSLIGYLSVLVVELPKTIHFVLHPVSLVVTTILVVELSEAVTHTIQFKAFVSGARLKFLAAVLTEWTSTQYSRRFGCPIGCQWHFILRLAQIVILSLFTTIILSVVSCI